MGKLFIEFNDVTGVCVLEDTERGVSVVLANVTKTPLSMLRSMRNHPAANEKRREAATLAISYLEGNHNG